MIENCPRQSHAAYVLFGYNRALIITVIFAISIIHMCLTVCGTTRRKMNNLFVIPCYLIGFLFIFNGIDGFQHYGGNDTTIWNETWIDKLKQDLLANYDTHARPSHHNKTMNLELALQVYHVTIDEFKSAVNVRAYMTMVWDDDKLRWNASEYGGLRNFRVHKYEIWEPDILLLNGVDTSSAMSSYGLIPCHIHDNGIVRWSPPVQFLSLCDLDFRLWPFDTQRCTLRITSATYDERELNLTTFNSSTTADMVIIHNTEWQLQKIKTAREIFSEDCCPESYVTLLFEFTLKRNSVIYKSIIVTPTFFIVLLNLVIFWLPPDSREKLILSGFLGVIISYFLIYFSQKVPPLLSKTPLIVIFYSGCLYQVTISLVISIIVINLSRKPHCRPPPRVLKEILRGSLGNFLGLSDVIQLMHSQRSSGGHELTESSLGESSNYAPNPLSNLGDHEEENKLMSSSLNNVHLEWILIATAIDRISFLFFCITFAIMGSILMMS